MNRDYPGKIVCVAERNNILHFNLLLPRDRETNNQRAIIVSNGATADFCEPQVLVRFLLEFEPAELLTLRTAVLIEVFRD
jgi:hypothetical protein